MRKALLLFVVTSLLIPLRSVFSQSLGDYVKQMKGDTLVIKDYTDMNNKSGSLYWALVLDTVGVPAGRVYELQAGGWFPLDNNPATSRQHPTMIVGSDPTMVVNNKVTLSSPPLISGNTGSLFSNTGGINAAGNLTIKNCALVPAATDGSLGWDFASTTASNLRLVFDNCLMERTRWIFAVAESANCNVTFRNCYFVNMSGQPCRRSGGVFDCFADLDTLLVENCTHIMAVGSLYRLRPGWQFKRTIFNHNTFVNCAGYAFMNPGYQSNVSLTNNIVVNSNIQSYPGIHSFDIGEVDPDWLPMGLVNVYPDSTDVANNTPRKFLVQNNLAYWDPSLAEMDSILDANKVNGLTNWRSQMIIMNSRTDSMFKQIGRFNTTAYRYLRTDTWKNQMPHFTDPKDLLTTQLALLKVFALGAVDTGFNNPSLWNLPTWRLVNTGSDKFVNPDWPIPVDLSYSDADLLSGGIGSFPLGDLNWFPTQKATWLAQRNAEYTHIQSNLDREGPLGIKDIGGSVPSEFNLDQNYPNPFNPSTVIRYEILTRSHVTLAVFNTLGQKVAELVNGEMDAGYHKIQFNATNLASGVYFYRIQAGSYVETKSLCILK